MSWHDEFDAAQSPQGAAFALKLGQLYNVTQPTFAIGELIYSDTATTLASLAPNTAASKKFLSMTGTGSAGAAPVWETIEAADITDFNEGVDDRAAALIQNGTGISWSYNDGAGTLTPTVTLAPFSTSDLAEGTNLYYTDERVDDRVAVLIQNGTGITWSYNDGAGTLTPTVTITQYTDEMAQDTVATLIQNGTGISWSYNDGANTLTPTVSLAAFSTTNLSEGSNLYFTDERAQDAVGGILTDSATIDFTYNDATPSITAIVIDDSISNAKLRDSIAVSVIGRSAASTGDPADIQAGNVGTVLRRDGSGLSFGAVDLADGDAVTNSLPIANGGTNATTAADAFTNLKQAASDTATGVIEIAVQSEMETGTDTTRAVVPGRQHFHPGHPKCWAYITVSGGTPTLATNYNITSITDAAVGVVSVTIATDFSSANWAGLVTPEIAAGAFAYTANKAAGTVDIGVRDAAGTLTDPTAYSLLGTGDHS